MSEAWPVVKSEDFWFEDGDIILAITEANVEHRFRIHRAILTIASPVFRDMLSMPQPSECKNPLIPLQGDSVHDMKVLLGALYCARKAQNPTLDMVSGIMRLSHKYQIEGLQQRMRRKLQKHWPLTYADYLAHLARFVVVGSPRYRLAQTMEAIETTQRCQVNEILPAAFYEIACAWGTWWNDIIGTLSPENVARLSVGRTRSEQRLRSLATGSKDLMMWKTSPTKTIFQHRATFGLCIKGNPGYCPNVVSQFRNRISGLLFDGNTALLAIQQFSQHDFLVCHGCREWFIDVINNKFQELWENIPADFNLPGVNA